MPDQNPLLLANFDPFDAAVQQCPHNWYSTLRQQAPVHYVADRDLWYVTSRELVLEALKQPAVFSSRLGRVQSPPSAAIAERIAEIEAQGWPPTPTMILEDPPAHHYYRRLVARTFSPRFVERLTPTIDAFLVGLVDAAMAKPAVEFVQEFAVPFPLRVIADILNVPTDRLDDFKRWSDEITLTIGANVDDDRRVTQALQILEFQRYFADQIEQRRSTPVDDLLTGLVRAHISPDGEEDAPLSTAALLSIITQLLVAGNETTTNLLSGALYLLGTEPSWWNWLREDPAERASLVVDEALRHASPVQGMFRIVSRPTQLGGVDLPPGARVLLCFGSANRDEAAFAEPDTFNPLRENAAAHLAFGEGVHYCLGAPLARLESRLALQRLAERAVAVELLPDNGFLYQPSFVLRGLKRLNVHFVPADTSSGNAPEGGSGVTATLGRLVAGE